MSRKLPIHPPPPTHIRGSLKLTMLPVNRKQKETRREERECDGIEWFKGGTCSEPRSLETKDFRGCCEVGMARGRDARSPRTEV